MLAAERLTANSKYARNKLYLQFELEDSWNRPSVPLITVFYSDKSYLKGMTHHPIYRECMQYFAYFHTFTSGVYFTYFAMVCIFCVKFNFSEALLSLLDIHEDLRAKPSSWIVLAWMPIIDEEKGRRPSQGYESNAARNTRLYHEFWRQFLVNGLKSPNTLVSSCLVMVRQEFLDIP